MRGGRRAWWVGVVVLLLAKSTWGNFIVYKLGEPGMCTGFVKTLSTLTDTCCAMACSASKFVNSIFTSLQKKKNHIILSVINEPTGDVSILTRSIEIPFRDRMFTLL